MSISINNNNGIIEVSQDGNVPRSYFGTFGKFYPSGSVSGAATTIGATFSIVSNDTSGCADAFYSSETQGSTSGIGSGAIFDMFIINGAVADVYNQNVVHMNGSGSGYLVGDTMTIYGSDYGGTGSCVVKIDALGIDGFLISLDKDIYDVRYYDLVIGGTSPTTLSGAADLLANLFSTI